MSFSQSQGVRYYRFESLGDPKINHAVFTRHGGVSSGQWSSLNVSISVGDDEENVRKNRQISIQAAGRDIGTMSDSWLVHGKAVKIYDQPRPANEPIPPKADIILTDNPEVTLFMRYADCVPILLYDPVQHAIGLAHAGWRGTVLGVGQAAVEEMQGRYGSNPSDIIAGIGPSIGPEAYEVGIEVVTEVEKAFGSLAGELLPKFDGAVHFDLWQANRVSLEKAGVREIEVAGICTSTQKHDWFSHRGDKGKTGRFGVLFALNE